MARDPEEIARRLGLPPELAKFMPRYIKIESGGDPNARTGRYVGLLQMGPEEIAKYGGKDVQHGAQMYADRAKWFAQQFGRQPDPTELYLINQQGEGGVTNHMKNPGAPAWQNMANTAEGRQKGEAWAKKAIWGNVPDDIKKQFPGGVDKLTSAQFMDIWRHKVERVPIPPRPPGDVPLAQQFAERPSTANPLPADAPGEGQFFRQRGSQGQGELAPQQVLANAPGMVPTPRERPGAAGPNAAQTTAIDQAYGRKVPAAQGGGRMAQADAKPAQAAASAGASNRTVQIPPGQTLGDKIIASYGPRGANLSTYIDPNTGHQWISGSVDGMDMTRDIGPQSPARSAPARPAAAANAPAPAGRGRTPTGPVPPAPEAAGRLAKPEQMAPPEQTLQALDRMRQRPNTLTDLYKSDTPPTNPAAPPSFRDIANTPPLFNPPNQTTLQGLPLEPYNAPTPLPRPSPGQDLGTPPLAERLMSLLNPPGGGANATPIEAAQKQSALQMEANRGGPPISVGGDSAGGVSLHVGPGAISRLMDALSPPQGFGGADNLAVDDFLQEQKPSDPNTFRTGYLPPKPTAAPTAPSPPRNAQLYGGASQPRDIAGALAGAAAPTAGSGYSPGFLDPLAMGATPAEEQTRMAAQMAETARAAMTNPPPQPVQQWQQQAPVNPPVTGQPDAALSPFGIGNQQTFSPLPILPDDLFANLGWGGWDFSPG